MKKIFIALAFITVFIFTGYTVKSYAIPSVPKMFKMNKQLQEEGYYMAEFEYKMLGIVYNLDHGNYHLALSQLNKLDRQLKTRDGLIKVPAFKNKKEEMDFYLLLQNPKTGAFMDDSYPFCTYTGPTSNVLNHLDELSRESGIPLKLKYPLSYLDKISTPYKLKEYLDDVSTVGWIGSRFPQTSFHFARDLLSLIHEDDVIAKYKLYPFSYEWQKCLIKWFYDSQDPKTGLWGPKSKNGKLRKLDTMNTASILRTFVDRDGNDIFMEFPLRYRNELAQTIFSIDLIALPDDDDTDDWHEWNLCTSKTIRTLFQCLWPGLSDENKKRTIEITRQYLQIKFERFYVSSEGAFSFYPNAEHATLDGSNEMIGTFLNIGCFSEKKYIKMWGTTSQFPEVNFILPEISEAGFLESIKNSQINSVRIYKVNPGTGLFYSNVIGIFYPKVTPVLDVLDFIPQMSSWVNSTNQSMGNWVSREEILHKLADINFPKVPVYKAVFPKEELNYLLKNNGSVILIGFDELQLPQFKIKYSVK